MLMRQLPNPATLNFKGSSSDEFNALLDQAVCNSETLLQIASVSCLSVQDRTIEYGKRMLTFTEIVPDINGTPMVHQALDNVVRDMRRAGWECLVSNIPDPNAPKAAPRKPKRLKLNGNDERDEPRKPSFDPSRPMHILALPRKGLIR